MDAFPLSHRSAQAGAFLCPHIRLASALLLGLVFSANAAYSASGVSPRFDGRYEGALTPATDSNPQQCQAVTVDNFVIQGGHVRPPAKVAESQTVIFDGFVTEEGFITGHFRLPGGGLNQFEGRMINDPTGVQVSGGLIDEKSACEYLLKLRKAD